MKSFTAVVMVGALGITPAGAACSVEDIRLVQIDWQRVNSNTARVVGEMSNTCADPTGAEVQFVFRDAAGKVVTAPAMWPASTRNIGPNSTYPFSMTLEVGAAATKLETRILGVRVWTLR